MGKALDKYLSLDIPEELHLSRNLQTLAARQTVKAAPTDEYLASFVAHLAGSVMELEERLVAVEREAGITPPAPKPYA